MFTLSFIILTKLSFVQFIQGIRHGDTITCPFCRDTFVKFDVESLPNNPYALHMLKFKEKKEPPKPVEIAVAPVYVISSTIFKFLLLS
jgi:hypothetical protein